MMLRVGEDTHNKKRDPRYKKQIKSKGMTPITKNVIVIDEQGNEYGVTYPKRARGLVKNGRARFVEGNKICLACPPDNFLEENKMEDNRITARELLDQLSKIQEQIISSTMSPQEVEIMMRMISLYEKMYDDIRSEQQKKVELISNAFNGLINTTNESEYKDDVWKNESIGHITDKIAELVALVVAPENNQE